jgi:sugar/nucleoside kinase (ribokinase family)
VFANEEEAMAFTGLQPEPAISQIARLCEIAVVKTGKTGSLVQSGSIRISQGIIPAAAIDTTGAGDAYAAGFLYGLTKGYPLQICAQIAALVSAKAVEVIGAKIPETLWPSILKMVGAITV